jgi:hypothetical protein
MEIIKKTISRLLTTGTTSNCSGDCFVIIPDISAVYNLKVLLTTEYHDFGFFDAYEEIENYTTYTNYTSFASGIVTSTNTDTGIGESLLFDDDFI